MCRGRSELGATPCVAYPNLSSYGLQYCQQRFSRGLVPYDGGGDVFAPGLSSMHRHCNCELRKIEGPGKWIMAAECKRRSEADGQ